jgi:pimeloyl-ACP methyl ester carboxylesterase
MTAPRLAAAVGLLLLGLVALLWFGQRRLLYFPSTYPLDRVQAHAAALGLDPWAPGGAFLGWRRETPGARGTVLVFHGNAGAALDRLPIVEALVQAVPERPLDVVLVEYPGYGPRPGSPSEPSIREAAREALREARRAGRGPVFVAGESLGTAAAAALAAEAPGEVAGLLLVTPLASVPAVARRHYPWLPAAFARDPWRTDLALPRYPGPVAFVVAERDEVTFADLGKALFDAYPGRKRLWVEAGAGHNTLDWRTLNPVWAQAMEFVTGG